MAIAFCGIALLYSSVGFGGGSSYLALLTLVFTSFHTIRTTALLCNLIVVLGSCWLFYKNGRLLFRKFFPFVISSVPMAFLGALFSFSERLFFILLGGALLLASVALTIQTLNIKGNITSRSYGRATAFLLGSGVGLLSGMVGIGGGIFLAPVLHYMKWEKPVIIAALTSFFILVNSLSGIGGLLVSGSFEVNLSETMVLLGAVLIGGQIGVRLTLKRIAPRTIRLLTALLVFAVGSRVLWNNGLSNIICQ